MAPFVSEILPARSYVINLDRRPERLESFWKMYDSAGFPSNWPRPIRYRAVDGDIVGLPDNFTHNAYGFGCGRSHSNVLSEFLHDFPYSPDLTIEVFEDDVVVANNFAKRLPIFLENVPADWDCILLGAQFKIPPIYINNSVVKVVKCQRTMFYIIRGRFIKKLFSSWANTPYILDWRWHEFQAEYNVYCTPPDAPLVMQNAGSSDIDGKSFPVRGWKDEWKRRSKLFC